MKSQGGRRRSAGVRLDRPAADEDRPGGRRRPAPKPPARLVQVVCESGDVAPQRTRRRPRQPRASGCSIRPSSHITLCVVDRPAVDVVAPRQPSQLLHFLGGKAGRDRQIPGEARGARGRHEKLRDRKESTHQQRERHHHLEQSEAGATGAGDRNLLHSWLPGRRTGIRISATSPYSRSFCNRRSIDRGVENRPNQAGSPQRTRAEPWRGEQLSKRLVRGAWQEVQLGRDKGRTS